MQRVALTVLLALLSAQFAYAGDERQRLYVAIKGVRAASAHERQLLHAMAAAAEAAAMQSGNYAVAKISDGADVALIAEMSTVSARRIVIFQIIDLSDASVVDTSRVDCTCAPAEMIEPLNQALDSLLGNSKATRMAPQHTSTTTPFRIGVVSVPELGVGPVTTVRVPTPLAGGAVSLGADPEILELYDRAADADKAGRDNPVEAMAAWARLARQAGKPNPYAGEAKKRADEWGGYTAARLHAVAIAADGRGKSEPDDAVRAWRNLAEFMVNNPYRSLAETRASAWQKFSAIKELDSDRLRRVLPLNILTIEQKSSLLESYRRAYGSFDIELQILIPEEIQRELNRAIGSMSVIAEGPFWMGCAAKDSACPADEKPGGLVTLGEYFIDKTEVTVDAYRTCVGEGKCTHRGLEADDVCTWDETRNSNRPISCVTWEQARSFCLWAGKRLPTEAEWEKAARGTDQRPYPWGNTRPTCEYAVMNQGGPGCGTGSIRPVGSLPLGSSPYGALDMAGNVSEWVADDYVSDAKPLQKVARGGEFRSASAESHHVSRRGHFPPDYSYFIGFRCAYSRKTHEGLD